MDNELDRGQKKEELFLELVFTFFGGTTSVKCVHIQLTYFYLEIIMYLSCFKLHVNINTA